MASSPVIKRKITLNNCKSNTMPAIGLGTYRMQSEDQIMQAVDAALGAGYRLFDTAAVYKNERLIGDALRKCMPKHGLEREDLFITTKLNPRLHSSVDVEEGFRKSLENLQMEYVDLYLIHFPGMSRNVEDNDSNNRRRRETWEKLVQFYDDGRARSIGVSNFTVKHLRQLMAHHCGISPAVNQVEWHPYFYQRELLSYCQREDIALQAYCSFGGQSCDNNTLVEDNVVVNVAKEMRVTPQQLLLAWALQNNVSVIPKSTNPEHIVANTKLDFVISDKDMKALNELRENNTKYAWDPATVA